MKLSLSMIVLAVGLTVSGGSFALAPAAAPAGSTGQCNDGSYYSGAHKQGACSSHKGLKDWYADAAAPAAVVPAVTPKGAAPATLAVPAVTPKGAVPTTLAVPAVTPKGAVPATLAVPATASKPTAAAAPAVATAGGGVGQVWVNSKSNTYHCFGSKYYGKTKEGSYMTEAAAKAADAHANRGKACS